MINKDRGGGAICGFYGGHRGHGVIPQSTPTRENPATQTLF